MTIWKSVDGYAGLYEVSSAGGVRSVRRDLILKGCLGSSGYLTVSLSREGMAQKTFAVHALVAKAFLGDRPEGMHVNHLNADKTDNRPVNLEYCTPSENRAHSFRLGNESTAGDRSRVRKVDSAVVAEIRRRRTAGEYQKVIAADYGITQSAVSLICHGKRWQ